MADKTNAVTPLAANPITTSFGPTPIRLRIWIGAVASSSASSIAFSLETLPPETMAINRSGSIPNVGGISAASAVAIRPLVPEPT